MNKQSAIVAWVGINWADEGHAVCEYEVATGSKQSCEIEHRAESLQDWMNHCGFDTAENE